MSIKSSIILRPILSEKGTHLGETQNKYVFQVEKQSNKLEIKQIYNYYGLVEQTGSIFFQCKKNNYFHTSIFSDIIVRNKKFHSIINQKGLVQLISLIPTSYPGHNIITQDIGKIIGEDDCSCGLKGKYFKIYGRLKSSEIRGCSDAR